MQFGFYPGHERGCGHPRKCPHLGGASVGYLVHIVNTSEDCRLHVHRQLDAKRERNSRLFAQNQQLEKKIEQLKLELRLERQQKFATNKQKANPSAQGSATTPEPEKPAGTTCGVRAICLSMPSWSGSWCVTWGRRKRA